MVEGCLGAVDLLLFRYRVPVKSTILQYRREKIQLQLYVSLQGVRDMGRILYDLAAQRSASLCFTVCLFIVRTWTSTGHPNMKHWPWREGRTPRPETA